MKRITTDRSTPPGQEETSMKQLARYAPVALAFAALLIGVAVPLYLAAFPNHIAPILHFFRVACAQLRELVGELESHLLVGVFGDAFLHEQAG
jgi:hypothetical protein